MHKFQTKGHVFPEDTESVASRFLKEYEHRILGASYHLY